MSSKALGGILVALTLGYLWIQMRSAQDNGETPSSTTESKQEPSQRDSKWNKAVQDIQNESSCLVQIDKQWYDVSEFMSRHPGGEEVFSDNAGKDVSQLFHSLHSHSPGT